MKFTTNIKETLENASQDILDDCVLNCGSSEYEDVKKAIANLFAKGFREALNQNLKFNLEYSGVDDAFGIDVLDENGLPIINYCLVFTGYYNNIFFIEGGHTLEVI